MWPRNIHVADGKTDKRTDGRTDGRTDDFGDDTHRANSTQSLSASGTTVSRFHDRSSCVEMYSWPVLIHIHWKSMSPWKMIRTVRRIVCVS